MLLLYHWLLQLFSICRNYTDHEGTTIWQQWRIQGGGGATGAHPPKIGSTMFFVIQFLIKMLKNKAPIALETIKTTPELPGPLSRPWTPAESEFGSALVMSMLAHNLLRPP